MTQRGSPQTLTEEERRVLAGWAADCAGRVLPIFERDVPGHPGPRAAIARAKAYSNGELDTATEIRLRFAGGGAARDAKSPAAAAAARAAGQAAAICHMGAHAFGAAAYAARAASLISANADEATAAEIERQLSSMSEPVRRALRLIPPVGENSSGPLGPGLLSSGQLGVIIRRLQEGLR